MNFYHNDQIMLSHHSDVNFYRAEIMSFHRNNWHVTGHTHITLPAAVIWMVLTGENLGYIYYFKGSAKAFSKHVLATHSFPQLKERVLIIILELYLAFSGQKSTEKSVRLFFTHPLIWTSVWESMAAFPRYRISSITPNVRTNQ